MFNALKVFRLQHLSEAVAMVAERVEANKVIAVSAVEGIKRSNGQIPAAVRNQPYKRH